MIRAAFAIGRLYSDTFDYRIALWEVAARGWYRSDTVNWQQHTKEFNAAYSALRCDARTGT